MNNLIGMDVGVVRNVASGLQAQAQALGHVISSVDNVVNHSLHVWEGQDSANFSHQWHSTMRAQLNAARAALQEMVESANRNAEQQQAASTPGAIAMGGGSGQAAPMSSATVAVGSFVLTTMQFFSDKRFSSGRYTNAWNDFTRKLGSPSLLQFKRSPILHALNSERDFIEGAGMVANVLAFANDSSEAYDAFKSGHLETGISRAADAGADAIGATPLKRIPAVELGQLAVHIWADAARESQNIDFNSLPQTFDYMAEHPEVLPEELGKAVLTEGTRILGWL